MMKDMDWFVRILMAITFLLWLAVVVGLPLELVLDPPKHHTATPFVILLWILLTAGGVKAIQNIREVGKR